MVTKNQTLIAGALLLSTWFCIDAASSFGIANNICLEIHCALLMLVTTAAFLWLLLTKRPLLWQIGKTLWKSEFFDAMVSLAFFLPLLPGILQTDSLNPYLAYASWGMSIITLFAALFLMSQDRKLKIDSGNELGTATGGHSSILYPFGKEFFKGKPVKLFRGVSREKETLRNYFAEVP